MTASTAPKSIVKPRLSFWQIWNMSLGFGGIQFGWGLQMANMSAIYEYLGAHADQLAYLWLAAPLTGLLVQPIIGHASDRTWNALGRRRPYFLAGAILSSLALILMPRSSALWMAAGLLWILDGSINVSMEPFRAFVADMLPEEQRTSGFAMQSIFIGIGAVVASAMPYILTHWFHVSDTAGASSAIPFTVRLSFYLGAAAFFGAVLYTIVTTKEYPPEDMEAFRRMKAEHSGIGQNIEEILHSIRTMPKTMRQLAPVQFCTWLGLFCMWLYFGVAIARSVFGASSPQSPSYTEGIKWGGICFAAYSVVTFVFAFALPAIAKAIGRKGTHVLCLLCGGLGLLSVAVIHTPWMLMLPMAGVGIAWASILAMPYAVLVGSLPPAKIGVYMGIFNFFIVLPEIIAGALFNRVVNFLIPRLPASMDVRLAVVMIGGCALIVGALLMLRVEDANDPRAISAS
ncbi:MAG TPA: MFS transporter [Terriglobales bacterium]|nr:MFS transporter [Terriglobales bacterium]